MKRLRADPRESRRSRHTTQSRQRAIDASSAPRAHERTACPSAPTPPGRRSEPDRARPRRETGSPSAHASSNATSARKDAPEIARVVTPRTTVTRLCRSGTSSNCARTPRQNPSSSGPPVTGFGAACWIEGPHAPSRDASVAPMVAPNSVRRVIDEAIALLTPREARSSDPHARRGQPAASTRPSR
jgi:hypothetical protein